VLKTLPGHSPDHPIPGTGSGRVSPFCPAMRQGRAGIPLPGELGRGQYYMPALGSGIKDSRKSARPEILQIL